MNRRQFLKRGAMTAVAVSVAPAAVLAAEGFACGGIATGGTFIVGERACETILPCGHVLHPMCRCSITTGGDYFVNHDLTRSYAWWTPDAGERKLRVFRP